jgi:hypothetical protein
MPLPPTRRARPVIALALGCVLLLAVRWASGALDQDGDNVPDVWALDHGLGTLDLAPDTDHDGFTNAQEAAAGTNPLSAESMVKVASLDLTGAGVEIRFPAVAGKRYAIERSAGLTPPLWLPGAVRVAGSDGDLVEVLAAPEGAPGLEFYRVVVSDTDTDGDGVDDYEERRLGTNPANSHSAGPGGPPDLDTAIAALTQPSTVSIAASDTRATEPPANVTATDPAAFTVTRTGGLKPLTVNLTYSGPAVSGSDFAPLASTVYFPLGARSVVVPVTPLSDSAVESPEALVATVVAGAGYQAGSGPAAVLIHDLTGPSGTGLNAAFWNESANTSSTVPAVFPGAPVVTRIDPSVNFTWGNSTTQGVDSPAVGVNVSRFSSRWTGEVLPAYSQPYTFFLEGNDATRLWVNGQLLIDNWPPKTLSTSELSAVIELQAGIRVPIVVEHYEVTGTADIFLEWSSNNQPKEFIPQSRLFPNAPPQILSPLSILLIANSGNASIPILASGLPTHFEAANLPPGFSLNATTGVLAVAPTQVGTWQIAVTANNTYGHGSALIDLSVVETGGFLACETWNGTFADFNAVPFQTPPDATANLTSLDLPAPAVAPSASRIRGYVTAPTTGTYRFWITGNATAELWISDDDEAVNLWKRATLSNATGYQSWADGAKSPGLHLESGRRYQIEIRLISPTTEGHVSVGWLLPGDPGLAPAGPIPGYILSPWLPTVDVAGGTLLTATLTPQGGAQTGGYGSATLRLSTDKTQAVLAYGYANLSSPETSKHVHSGTHGGAIMFDIDDATPQADGSYLWPIAAAGALSAQDVINVIESGQAYLNIHSANYPAGEIKGFFLQQDGSSTFAPPAAPPAWGDDHADAAAAARFLIQATFGPDAASMASVQADGYSDWIDDQIALPPTLHLPNVEAGRNVTNPGGSTYPGTLTFNTWWRHSITAPDQLRQRMAFALSQIFVVSESGVLDDRANALSSFYDTLLINAFGNARELLEAVTLHPAMGRYLDMWRNDKPNRATGLIPNENYAREILQLFSIGLYRLHPDGSLVTNSKGQPVPTYDQEAVIGFAHAFTGWDYSYNGSYRTSFGATANWTAPMREVPPRHFTGPKRILNNVVLPGLPEVNGAPLDPYASTNSTINATASFQALPVQELEATHDAIFNHPNFGPFLCRQLIQRFVTSTPSRGYIYRVTSAFNDNGAGVRGDLAAVIRAILLDYEARSADVTEQQGYGKQREPVLRVTAVARAFPASTGLSGNYSQNGGFLTVTTDAPHRLASGNPANLTFSDGTPSPATSGLYSVTTSGGAPLLTNTTFGVRARDAANIIAWTQNGTDVTVTTGTNHGLTTGNPVYVAFANGAPSNPPTGVYTATVSNSTRYVVSAPDAVSRSATGNLVGTAAWIRGGYVQTGNVIMLTCQTTHGQSANATITFDFTQNSGTGTPAETTYSIASVIDDYQFTVAASDSTNRTGTFAGAFSNPTLVRSGNLTGGFSDYTLGLTDTELGQTPMSSPTVFNFYLPDYQHPGALGNAGLITPEFQLSSETNVINQANFLGNGIFNPTSNSTILSSFRQGQGDIVIDLRPWMGNRTNTNTPWTNDANLGALIDEWDAMLLGGQLPDGAKSIIQNYTSNTTNISYNGTAPTDMQKRDRARAVLHLMTTSPDFTIQR